MATRNQAAVSKKVKLKTKMQEMSELFPSHSVTFLGSYSIQKEGVKKYTVDGWKKTGGLGHAVDERKTVGFSFPYLQQRHKHTHTHMYFIHSSASSFFHHTTFFHPSFLSPSARGFPKTHVAAMTGKSPSKPHIWVHLSLLQHYIFSS